MTMIRERLKLSQQQLVKRFLCLALCLTLAVAYSFRAPVKVEAAAPAIVAGSVIVAAAVAALGVSITTAAAASMSGGYEAACQAFWDSLPESMRNAIVPVEIGGAMAINATKEFLQAVADWACGSTGFVTAAKTLPTNMTISGSFAKAELTTFLALPSNYSVTLSLPKGFSSASDLQIFSYINHANASSLVGKTLTYGIYELKFYLYPGMDILCMDVYKSGVKQNVPLNMLLTSSYSYAGVGIYNVGGVNMLCYLQVSDPGRDSPFAQLGYLSTSLVLSGDAVPAWGQDVFNPGRADLVENGTDVINNSAANVIDHVIDVAGTADNTIPLYVPATGTIQDTMTSTQDTILTAPQGPGPTDPDDPDNPGGKPGGLPNLTLPEIIFKEKFPFCLPWDLYMMFSGFAAEPQVPHFEIPLKNERLGIDEKIVIDFGQFEPLAVICRWFIGASFTLGLIFVTRKLIGGGG